MKFGDRRTGIACSLVSALFLTLACNKNQDTDVQAIATANSVKTGMFMPERSSDVSLGFAKNLGAEVSADDLAKKLKMPLKANGEQKLYVVPTAEGDQILVLKQGVARPLPVGGITRSGKTYYLSAPVTVQKGAVGGLVGTMFFETDRVDAQLKGTVSPDGNQSNMHLLYEIKNSLGRPEDYLVSYLSQLDTNDGGKVIRLVKVGNNIIEGKSGESILEYREMGNQVWRVYGVFSNNLLKHGSVLWSPDMSRFFSVREKGAPVVEWKKQDDNSMDIVSKNVSGVTIPAKVKELLEDPNVTKDAKSLALTGPVPGTSARRATSLSDRGNVKVKGGLGLASFESPSVAPADTSSQAYHDFFDPEAASKAKGFALDGAASPFNGRNQYPAGARVDLGNGVMGTVVGATSNNTVPGGWFSREQTTRTTYVQTPGGTIREMKSTNGGAVEQRFLNQYDIQNMAQATQATLNSPQHAQQEQAFRDAIRDSNTANQAVVNSANGFENKYATPQGVAANVVLPLATAGVNSKVTGAIGDKVQSGIAGVGVDAVGSTAQFLANGAQASDAPGVAGNAVSSGAQIINQATTANNPALNGRLGVATAVLGAATTEGVNAAGGNADYTKGALNVGVAGLGAAANTVLPGSGVAVQIAGDAGGVGIDYARANAANNAVTQTSADYYRPVNQNTQLQQVLGNIQAPAAAPAEAAPVAAPAAAPATFE